MAGKKASEALVSSLLRAAAMDRMDSRFHVRAGDFFRSDADGPRAWGRKGRMKTIRAIAATVVAVCISFGGNSLLAQAVPSKPKPSGEHVPSQTQLPPDGPQSSLAGAIKSSIGKRAGDPGFNADADLNGDGVVNALDIAMLRLGRSRETSPPDGQGAVHALTGERIIVEGQTTLALPGSTVSVLFLIRDNSTPILSYTLDVNIVPQSGSMGTVTANVSMTNFYDVRNLITAGGAMRDPFFSVIQDNGGGVSVTTITSDLSTVQAVVNVNDVLAQVFLDVPPDALGDFTIELASGSVLVDGNAATVLFSFTPGTIRVTNSIPALSEWGMMVLGLFVVTAGCVVLVKRRGVVESEVGQC